MSYVAGFYRAASPNVLPSCLMLLQKSVPRSKIVSFVFIVVHRAQCLVSNLLRDFYSGPAKEA
jgi:hypothetical protein